MKSHLPKAKEFKLEIDKSSLWKRRKIKELRESNATNNLLNGLSISQLKAAFFAAREKTINDVKTGIEAGTIFISQIYGVNRKMKKMADEIDIIECQRRLNYRGESKSPKP